MSGIDDVLTGIIRRSAAAKAPGDYCEDGLLHCGKCRTPKQVRIDMDDIHMTVGCMCQCESDALEAEEQRARQRERMAKIMGLRVLGIQDRALRKATFAAAKDSPILPRCRAYVERWREALERNAGLLFWGGMGTGKTFAAACIANALIDRGVPALITSFPKILNAGWDKAELTGQMQKFPLLVLDDLGVERSSDYALEVVQMVVDERYKSALPLIVTTNLTLDELRNPPNMRCARVYDRVLEMCTPVHFAGASRRREIAEEKRRFAEEIFS